MKIKIVIIIAAICFAIIPMAARVFLSDYFIRKDSTDAYEQEVISMAENQTSALQAVQDIARAEMKKLSENPYMATATAKVEMLIPVKNFVKSLEENRIISTVRIIDAQGNIVAGTGDGTQLNGYEQYLEYEDNNLYFDTINTSTSNMFIKKKMNNCTLIISYSVPALYSRIICSNAFDLPDKKSDGRIAVVDSRLNWSTGTGIYNNFVNYYDSSVIDRMKSITQDGAASAVIKFRSPQGTDRVASVVRVGGENGLYAIADCNQSVSGLFSNSNITIIMVVSVLLAAAGIGAAIAVSNSVTKPLKKIGDTLERVRRGDHESRITTINNNEYGQLSRQFNNLIDEIVVSEDRYKTISDMSDNIIFEWNFITNEVTFSNNFNKKFSYRAPSDHFGDSFLLKAKIHPDDADRYRADLDALEKGNNFERNEYRIKNIYGDFIWVLMRTATLKDKDGKVIKVVGVMVDIDRAKKSEAKLTEQASYDALTELYNRETIETQINNEISLSEMRKTEMAVLFIDVDDFKHFNDNYSHATGDQVLKFVARTIKETVGENGFAGRYGGDEFIALVRNAETNEPALIAQKIIETLGAGFEADIGEKLNVSVSIGIAVIKDDYNTRVEYLIGKADDAMYSVKKSGKSNYAFI